MRMKYLVLAAPSFGRTENEFGMVQPSVDCEKVTRNMFSVSEAWKDIASNFWDRPEKQVSILVVLSSFSVPNTPSKLQSGRFCASIIMEDLTMYIAG
jgi:hypothetical protein